MAQLAEAYFHLKRIDLDRKALWSLGDYLSETSREVALQHFPDECELTVHLSPGSLRGWLRIGVALTVYGAVADYKSFKESIPEIISDGQKFSQRVFDLLPRRPEISGAVIYRQERRTKTIGQIKRLIERRDRLERNRSQLSTDIVRQEEIEIERLLQRILVDIEPSERAVLRKLLGEVDPTLPVEEIPRVAITQPRSRQEPLFQDSMYHLVDTPPDYHRQFRLSENPFRRPVTTSINVGPSSDNPESKPHR